MSRREELEDELEEEEIALDDAEYEVLQRRNRIAQLRTMLEELEPDED